MVKNNLQKFISRQHVAPSLLDAPSANIWFALALCIFCIFSTVSSAKAGTLSKVATRLTISPLEPTTIGKKSVIIVHLTDIEGKSIGAVGNEVLYFFMDGVQKRRIRTDDNGMATFHTKNDLPAGTYTIEIIYKGSSGLLPSTASAELVVLPAVVEIHTVPPLPGMSFSLAGRRFTSDEAGVAQIEVNEPGSYVLEVLQPQVDNSEIRASFSRWGDDAFSPSREVVVPIDKPIDIGFEISYRVSQTFIDLDGQPVDPARVTSLTFKGSNGTTHLFKDNQPHWLLAGRVARLQNGLQETRILYSLMSVIIDGSNVVSQAQQRFQVNPNDVWPIRLLLYSASFSARDLLFPFPMGTGIRLEYPDGHNREFPFDSNRQIKVESLARGLYKVTVIGAKGIAPPTPIAMSRDQTMELMVISYLDMTSVSVLGVFLSLGLLFFGRPELFKIPVGLPGILLPKRRAKRLRRVFAIETETLVVLKQCPACQATARQAKAGRNRSGSQRYRCSVCSRVYTPSPKPLGFSSEIRARALQLYLEGNSRRSISLMLNIRPRTISKWVREHRIELPQVLVHEPVEVATPDEQPVSISQLNPV